MELSDGNESRLKFPAGGCDQGTIAMAPPVKLFLMMQRGLRTYT